MDLKLIINRTIATCLGVLFGVFILNLLDNKNYKTTNNECVCVSYKEYSLRQAKYEMYLDSLMNSKKSNRSRLQDSVTKHLKQLNF